MPKKKSWSDLSLDRKVLVWFAAILLIMLFFAGILTAVGQRAFGEFDLLLEDNVACYEVQEALGAEQEAFEDFVREASQENQRRYAEACAATRRCLDALPFVYEEIGEERYARTWNLLHGYEGYAQYRDAFVQQGAAADGHVVEMYRVMEMQEHLSDYALRLMQATLEHGNQIYSASTAFFKLMPGFLLVLLAAAVGLVIAIMRHLAGAVVRPLLLMAQASRRIAENDFSSEDITVESRDEVGELTRAFNRMKHTMAEHLATLEALHREEVAKLELEKNLDHTRLEMLKSQVDPHFLFNTLNMISCMARLEDAEVTDRMTVSLGNLFRYNLRTKEQEVYLDQELEAFDDYIYIQQMRFDGRITCDKRILVDAGKARIPSFTLQPVVENAFVHGLKAKEEGGRLLLRVWQEGRDLRVSIMDNGKGMSEEELSALDQRMLESERTGKGIGLGNIRRRIAMLYPDGEMRIYSKKGRGTVVQFRIPQTAGPEGEEA